MPNPTALKPTYFLTLFEEFKAASPAKIEAFIGIANNRVDAVAWGTNALYAAALLTAHMLSRTGHALSGGSGGGVGGAVTAESVGDLSRSYATVGEAGSGDQELLTTTYGQQYVELRRETISGPSISGPDFCIPPPGYSGDGYGGY